MQLGVVNFVDVLTSKVVDPAKPHKAVQLKHNIAFYAVDKANSNEARIEQAGVQPNCRRARGSHHHQAEVIHHRPLLPHLPLHEPPKINDSQPELYLVFPQ